MTSTSREIGASHRLTGMAAFALEALLGGRAGRLPHHIGQPASRTRTA